MKVREPSFFRLSLTPIETMALVLPAAKFTRVSTPEKSPLLAVPAPVRSRTLTPPAGAGADRVRVTVMVLPFSRPLASATETMGVTAGGAVSLSAIVPLTVLTPAIVYAVEPASVSVTDSSDSTKASSTGLSVTVATAYPARMVSTPPVRVPPVTTTV